MSKRVYLSDIVLRKRIRLEEQAFSIEELIKRIAEVDKRPSFYDAMAKDGLSIIGEIKKASPSKGLIREDFHPVELAKEYEGSVDAISVLTEEEFFMGGHEIYLRDVSEAVSLPTLYKDFIINPNQIYHAKSIGASCVLLIVAILSDKQLSDYITIAESIGLDTLVETHTKHEIKRAVKVGAKIIGINNRNLKTFYTDIKTTLKLRKYVPKDRIVISESGIFTPEDIKVLKKAKINGVLVGESFMRGDIPTMAKSFKEAYE